MSRGINVTRIERESDSSRPESKEKTTHKVSVVSSQRQWTATCEEVSYRR